MDTLFYDTKLTCDTLYNRYSLIASKEFIDCADKQLTDQFIKITGLKPGKNVSIALTSHYIGAPIYSEYITSNSNILGRKLCIAIYINHNWNPVTIFWKSKTGKDYKLHDTDIDYNDIVFWFEHLDADLYIKQLFPNQKLPFKTEKLSFELEVVRLNMDATLTVIRSSECQLTSDEIINEIDNFIFVFNEKSEKQDREHGVVHNWKTKVNGREITYDIDLGSAGVIFYKRFLIYLSKINCISKVTIG